MSFNVWGLPSNGEVEILDAYNYSSQYKDERMKAIGEEVSRGQYGLYLFQELWDPKDYETIRKYVPKEFHITKYFDFTDSSPKCEIQGCLPLCKYKLA